MQISELYRRGVVVPLNRDACEALACNDIEETTPVRAARILTQADFDSLWDLGLFESINQQLHLCIDDYEEELVAAPDIMTLKEIAASFVKKVQGDAVLEKFLVELLELCEIAIARKVAVYFIL